MKYLALEHELRPIPADDSMQLLAEEARSLWHLVKSGIVREQYFTAERHTAVLIMECVSIDDVETALKKLPLVSGGYIRFEIHQLLPYDGFERVFMK